MQEVRAVFQLAFLVFLVKKIKKRRQKQQGKLMAKSCSQLVNLPGAQPLMNPVLMNLVPKQNMLASFLDWKYICLHCSLKKEDVPVIGQTLHVCLSEYTETNHGSILAVNEFYACAILVKFIFKSFVSCNLQFQASVFETAWFTGLYWKINFFKVKTARLLVPHVFGLLNLNIHFCPICFHVVLLLTCRVQRSCIY